MPLIDIDDLVCASVIDRYASAPDGRVSSVPQPSGASPVSLARASDVLYIPELRVPIVERRIVPKEAIHDDWCLEFERSRNFQGKADAYRKPFGHSVSNEEVCILSNLYSENFGHWITEELIRVMILERQGFSGRYVMAGLPEFAFHFMDLMGVPRERIIAELSEPALFRSALFLSPIDAEHALEFSDLYLELRERLLGAGIAQSRIHERLWMVRGANVRNQKRDVVNLPEVSEVLGRYGFDMVDLAELPVSSQIHIASRASVLAGVHGAGFVHAFFMQPRSAVVECFSPNFINPSTLELCLLMRHRYAMLVHRNAYGAYPCDHDVKIDCAQLELTLQGLD
jgi:capsular polysaccharide biosynthesis protein